MDVLIMPTPPPRVNESEIQVWFSASGQPDQGQPPMQINFNIKYVYGTDAATKRTAILNAARQAYIVWCDQRGIVPRPANQMNVEILGV